jgi:hypothetical protein
MGELYPVATTKETKSRKAAITARTKSKKRIKHL